MESESKSETPCPDNAHGTPLTAPAGAGDGSAGNPAADERGRHTVCAALLRAERTADEVPCVHAGSVEAGKADARVLRQLRLAIVAGALPELERESELVELGAAAMLVIDAYGSGSDTHVPSTETDQAIALLRERVIAAFGKQAVRSHE